PFSEGLAPVLIDNQWGYIDKAGNLKIGARFTHARSFSEGLAAVKIRDDWGYINQSGEVVIKPRFATADDFKGGRAVVDISKESPEFPLAAQKRLDEIVKDSQTSNLKKALMAIAGSRKAGVIDRTGKFIVPAEYSTAEAFSDELCLVRKEQSIEFLDPDGKAKFKLELYDDAHSFSDGLAAVRQKDLWGFINTSGRLVVKPKFEQVQDFHHDLAPARLSGKWGFVDKRGEWVIQPTYDYIWEGFENGVAVAGNDLCPVEHQPGELTRVGGEYIVSKRTEVESAPDDSTTPFQQSRFAYPDYRFALINQEGKEQTQMKFDLIGPLSDGVRSARVDGQFGFIDNLGNTIVKPTYRWVSAFSDGLALVQEGDGQSRAVERNLQMLKNNSVPALVNDPKLIKQDIEVCSKVIGVDPTNVLAFRDRGYLKCSLSEFKESMDDFKEVTKLCPVSSEGYYWLGLAELQLGNYKDAVVNLTNALENDRMNARCYYARARAFSELEEYELALRDINQAIALDDHPFFQGARGTIYEKSGKADKGLPDLQIGRRAPILDPWPTGPKTQQELESEVEKLKEKASSLVKEKSKDDRLLALAYARWADGIDSLRRLKLREQKLLELEELYKECLELRRNALKLSKSSTKDSVIPLVYKDDLANALAQLSSWYVRVERYDEAAKLLEEGLTIVKDTGSATKEADFLNDLGKIYLAQDKYSEAEDSFEKALKLTEQELL
ncbi:MAG: WG repeat-containing protein, partial [Cyanobacteria bacterium]|nr:WG repeat-containing protein [Cyanobacteriota bacterium]